MGSPKASQLRLGDGVYVPTLAFFTPEDEVDASATEKHIIKLLESGVAGIVVHGSNGECAHLSPSERTTIIRVARDTIFHEGSGTRVPLIAGCGAQSTRETTELCEDAGKAGATHALVLPPSYYGGLLPDDLVIQHYYAVADKSPIPLLVYNFPGAAAGRDLSSDTILSIAKHPNVVGVKLTCGNTGKLARIAADCPEGFWVGGGSADFILQGHAVGANGTISGLANLCPKACVRITELAEEGNWKEARQLQAKVAKADWTAIKTGFVGVKAALGHFSGYGGEPRYKAGFATTQEDYNNNVPTVFAALNKLEALIHQIGGPYILGKQLTEVDVRAYATVVRFDVVYVGHFKCDLGTIRANYPVIHAWLKNLYWNVPGFKETTDFRHIKENYTKSHYKINPLAITPLGPFPYMEEGVDLDFGKLKPGVIRHPAVLERQTELYGSEDFSQRL